MKKQYENKIINVDTDAIFICKPTQEKWHKAEQQSFLEELNAQFPDKIKFEHDGIFDAVLVAGSKNYALLPEGSNKVKLKGSAFRDQKKEPALREMINKIIDAFIFEKQHEILGIYMSYVHEIMNLSGISRWSKKITVTEAVLNCRGYEALSKAQLTSRGIRTNETSVWDAIKNEQLLQSGDKLYTFPAILGESIKPHTQSEIEKAQLEHRTLRPRTKPTPDYGLLQPKFWNNNHDKEHLLKRLFNTIEIFDKVLDISQYKNYSLIRNYKLLTNNENSPII